MAQFFVDINKLMNIVIALYGILFGKMLGALNKMKTS